MKVYIGTSFWGSLHHEVDSFGFRYTVLPLWIEEIWILVCCGILVQRKLDASICCNRKLTLLNRLCFSSFLLQVGTYWLPRKLHTTRGEDALCSAVAHPCGYCSMTSAMSANNWFAGTYSVASAATSWSTTTGSSFLRFWLRSCKPSIHIYSVFYLAQGGLVFCWPRTFDLWQRVIWCSLYRFCRVPSSAPHQLRPLLQLWLSSIQQGIDSRTDTMSSLLVRYCWGLDGFPFDFVLSRFW